MGNPRYINPVLASVNDADRDLTRLIFSGLYKYDGSGNLIPDLADSYSISSDGKVYDFTLKQNIKWHDGKSFDASDVVFTIESIKNPINRSPERRNFEGMDVEKIDDWHVRFTMKNSYPQFLSKMTIGIIPRHAWSKIDAENFALADLNLKPIGTGPYMFKSIEKSKNGTVRKIVLTASDKYYGKKAYITNLTLYFYPDTDSMQNSLASHEINGMNFLLGVDKKKIDMGDYNIYSVSQPQYYAIFFNQVQNEALKDIVVRRALAQAIDRNNIINKVFDGEARLVNGPLIPEISKLKLNILPGIDYSIDQAKKMLDDGGWTDKNNDGLREKTVAVSKTTNRDIPLKIILTTANWPELVQIAELIKESWKALGASAEVVTVDLDTIQSDVITPRQFEGLLFGNSLTLDPDPFSFWHSSQKKSPGLNLAQYDNKVVDTLLSEARQELNSDSRLQKLNQFQKLVTDDIPAIFLFSKNYLFVVSKKVKGIDINIASMPSDRYFLIENWYIKVSRKLK